MVSKFNKNAIINGLIDYFCLVCDTYFTTEEAAEQHMQKQIHKKNLETSTYLDKYKDDCVRKVKAGYFCEYCNELLSTKTKVNLHIEEKTHRDNKGIALLRYVEEDVVAYNNLVIKEEAWHGFCGDTCVLCNCDVDDFDEHKVDHGHILKLVQGKINFSPNNNLYRNVDESAFQCLTCNKILAVSSFEKHYDDAEHQQIYTSCINNKIIDDNPSEKQNSSYHTPEDTDSRNSTPTGVEDSLDGNNRSNILDSIHEFQKNDININLDSEKAFCKKCYVDVIFDYNAIKKHIVEHKNKMASSLSSPANVEQNHKTTDIKPKTEYNIGVLDNNLKCITFNSDSDDEGTSSGATVSNSNIEQTSEQDSVINIEIFADNNKISYIAGNTEARCTVCNVKLPANLRNMKEHVNGSTHKIKSVPVPKPKCSGAHLPKKQMNEFIKEVIHIETGYENEVVINDEYCLTAMSYVLLKKETARVRCFCCEITFHEANLKAHLKASNHKWAVDHSSVVLRDDDEFVREIRSNVYHCGYCNLVVGDWTNFEEHLKSGTHKQIKKTMNYHLRAHQPAVMQHKRERQARMMFHLMMNRFEFPWQWLPDL